MAFHVACPITGERICHCGFGERRPGLDVDTVRRVEELVRDPWWVRADEGVEGDGDGKAVFRVLVPRIEPVVKESLLEVVEEDGGGVRGGIGDGEEGANGGAGSAQAKRVVLQRRAVAASQAAEDYVRKLETGIAVDDGHGEVAADHVSSAVKVICRMCFSGENEGSERAKKMLSCKMCSKKYHRSCLKSWAEYRDLFHWSSWACPSCRVCEICRRAGDPNKFMFCKRCDAAYHCYCQQPPHKNVSHGPYLCSKHTRCHSCGSTVHGSGHSTRWFLGYNFCDACGRLFMKEKYCPVCLKVYRDSEPTPMVCCDVCQRWVHCRCDSISDEKYLQFQADRNLHYKCAACRGDCYQIVDVDDAVQELWRRRDIADQELIAKLRAASGLPSQEEYCSISSYSDDEEDDTTIVKSDYGRSIKFSLKGSTYNAINNATTLGKKAPKSPTSKKLEKKKGYPLQIFGKIEKPFENNQNMERYDAAHTLETNIVDGKPNNTMQCKTSGSGTKIKFTNQKRNTEALLNKHIETSHIQSKETPHGLYSQEITGKHEGKNEPVKAPKLVIHFGGKNRKLNSSSMSDASSCQKDQEKANSNGSEESCQHKMDIQRHMPHAHSENIQIDDEKEAEACDADQLAVSKKNGDLVSVTSDHIAGNNNTLEDRKPSTKKILTFRRRKTEGKKVGEISGEMIDISKMNNDIIPQKTQHRDAASGAKTENNDADILSFSNNLLKDSRPSLKLKFKKPILENHSLTFPKEEERNVVKGQRSKRKRPFSLIDKGESFGHSLHEETIDEPMNADWILQKLGKNAIGKRVEVHQSSDDSWHKGVVSDVLPISFLSVTLDDGRLRTVELGKQGIRFIPHKQKRTKL